MKIIVVSDSHKQPGILEEIVNMTKADYYLHAGDGCLAPLALGPFISVRGNCDFYKYPLELIVEYGGVKIYLHHGHYYSIRQMVKKARQEQCKIVIYGHTHIPKLETIDGVYVLNPGSIAYPRGGSERSYALINITSNQEISFSFVNI